MPPHTRLTARGTSAPWQTPYAGKRILVVEDERLTAVDLQEGLEEIGYTVVGIASRSEDAIAKTAALGPDLVLMDIHLDGDVDGIQTAAMLRDRCRLPIVYLTANTDAETLARALATGPSGYLAKPYNPRTLRTTVELAFRQHETELALQGANLELVSQKHALEQQTRDLTELAERLRAEAILDPLSGLYNRRHLDAMLSGELARAHREHHPLGVILIDVDGFKSVNDTLGHAVADTMLRDVARLLRSQIRKYDIPCRYGGDEIVIIVPGASLQVTSELAERLRMGIEALTFQCEDRSVSITASLGVAAFETQTMQPEELLRAADAALYRAKRSGRNRVVTMHGA
jgi:diguanylate cyclase (GGDEF)-like protein